MAAKRDSRRMVDMLERMGMIKREEETGPNQELPENEAAIPVMDALPDTVALQPEPLPEPPPPAHT